MRIKISWDRIEERETERESRKGEETVGGELNCREALDVGPTILPSQRHMKDRKRLEGTRKDKMVRHSLKIGRAHV